MRITTMACHDPHPDPALRVLPDELLDPRAESVNGPGVPTGRNGGRVPNPVRHIPPPATATTASDNNKCHMHPLPWSKHSGGARLVPYGWIPPRVGRCGGYNHTKSSGGGLACGGGHIGTHIGLSTTHDDPTDVPVWVARHRSMRPTQPSKATHKHMSALE